MSNLILKKERILSCFIVKTILRGISFQYFSLIFQNGACAERKSSQSSGQALERV